MSVGYGKLFFGPDFGHFPGFLTDFCIIFDPKMTQKTSKNHRKCPKSGPKNNFLVQTDTRGLLPQTLVQDLARVRQDLAGSGKPLAGLRQARKASGRGVRPDSREVRKRLFPEMSEIASPASGGPWGAQGAHKRPGRGPIGPTGP